MANLRLTLRFDPTVTTREKVTASVDDVVARLAN